MGDIEVDEDDDDDEVGDEGVDNDEVRWDDDDEQGIDVGSEEGGGTRIMCPDSTYEGGWTW